MLCHLDIENIGIIDTLSIEFGEGLNVLTGETGAGKSIIISAFTLLLGERVKPSELLRKGVSSGRVRGLLRIPEMHPAVIYLVNAGFPVSEGEILIQREIHERERSRAWINGKVSTLSLLKELGNLLVDLHGSHDHQKLLDPSTHLSYLDRYGGLEKDVIAFQGIFEQWKREADQLKRLRENHAKRLEKTEFLEFRKRELDYLETLDASEEELEQEYGLLADGTRLKEIAYEARVRGSERDDSLLHGLKRFLQALEELSSLKPDFSPLQKELESAVISISEACQMLESFEESLSPDPARLENLEGLLGKLRKHQVKYACDFEGLKRHYRDIRDQLEELRNPPSFDEHVERVRTLEKQMSASGSTLTAHRKNASGKLKRALEIELKDLDMAHARVFPRLERRHPGPSGYDQAEFFLVTNPGEDPKPLHRIVSGGELCRIMLAFKTVLAKTDDIPILIFDEIDANIGGVTAVAAGKKMRSVAEGRQVITITHQPQIASKAGTHFAVAKERTPDAARTRIRRLDENQKVEELSRMLGGDSITSVVRKHAREMIRKDSARS